MLGDLMVIVETFYPVGLKVSVQVVQAGNLIPAGHVDYTIYDFQAEGLENIMLLAKDNLVPFYENAGFTNIGVSPVVHGVDPWNDLRMHL